MKKKGLVAFLTILIVSLGLLALAWKVPGFSDFYVKYVYPTFTETYGRLTGLFPFSIGEFMLYIAVVYVVLTMFILLLRFIMFLSRQDTFKLLNRMNLKAFAWILLMVLFIQTANCFIMYHTTPLYGSVDTKVNYQASVDDLFLLRERLVIRANALSETFDRDERGDILYEGDIKSEAAEAIIHLGEISKAYLNEGRDGELYGPLSRLTGYCPRPKPLLKSDFFSQQYIKGYFFPFSLEANYNSIMNVANFPDTFCHELSHFKGFILEDEASFVAYLACVNSGNEFMEYSGLINAIAYINVECNNELMANPDLAEAFTITPRCELVKHDMTFVSDEDWQKIEADALLSTEVTQEASNKFLDTNLTVNGVEDGVESYSRLVDLLLKYYFGDSNRYDS